MILINRTETLEIILKFIQILAENIQIKIKK